MKTLSKRSIDYMNLYLTMNNMDYITINKHDFKILYSYYNTGIFEINNLHDKIDKAREYIMTELISEWDIENDDCVSGSDLPVNAITPLLSILTGDDSNE